MTDELTWLRELERSVRDIRATDKYSEQMLCVSEVAGMVNQRIIGLLSEEVTGQVYPDKVPGNFPIDKTDAYEERQDAPADTPCEFNQYWGNRCVNPSRKHGEKHHKVSGLVWCDRCHAHHKEGGCQ